ncbi:hypothetical protein BR93DRAFT_930780 [Coniochaeta sp. PMI_546]|nr:hypothetical protein BR93DRAFT_930780 [Coniochaeta sp. PMI_546]
MPRFITDSRPLPEGSRPHAPTLQAIGAGLPRAATSSLQAAFETLGYTPCLHMAHIIPHPTVSRLLLRAMREKDPAERQKMVRQLHAGYAAVTDFPVVFFIEDLMDLYPEAKIVLNGRPNPGIWARSARASFGFCFSWRFRATGLLWTTDRIWYGLNAEAVRWVRDKLGVEDIFAAESYERYYEYVRTEARKRGREVLEFKAEDGWVPLCRFLGKDVPKGKEFPRLNERRDVEVIRAILVVRGLLAWAALGGGVWGAWRFGPRALWWVRECWTSGHLRL